MTLEEALQDPRLRRLAGFPDLQGDTVPPVGPRTGNQFPEPEGTAPLQEAASLAPEDAPETDFAAMAQRYLAAKGAGQQADRLTHLNEGFKDATETVLGARGMKLGRSAPGPSQEATARQAYQDELGTARTRAEIAKAGRPMGGGGRPAPMSDEQAREAVRASYPSAPTALIANTTAGNFEQVMTDLRAKAGAGERSGAQTRREAVEKSRLQQQAGEGKLNRSVQWARIRQQAEEGDSSRDFRRWLFEQEEDAKENERADKKTAKDAEVSVPGFEVTPGETPTPKDAETLKSINSANGELKRNITALRGLHAKYGTEWGGKGGVPMRQTMTAIRLAAKTIAELGALSGPDLGLMNDLSGGDPSTVEASLKAWAGVDNTDEAMTALEQWAGNRIAAASEARGYRPRHAGATTRVPPAKAPSKDAPGPQALAPDDKVRVMINGAPKRIPRANLEKARAVAQQRGDTFEVTDG